MPVGEQRLKLDIVLTSNNGRIATNFFEFPLVYRDRTKTLVCEERLHD